MDGEVLEQVFFKCPAGFYKIEKKKKISELLFHVECLKSPSMFLAL